MEAKAVGAVHSVLGAEKRGQTLDLLEEKLMHED